MTIKAIGAGFGRTGTESLKLALEMLGFGPTHHMFEVRENPIQRARWSEFLDGGEPDWPLLFEGFESAVDWPAAAFWRETMDHYPDAKVILTHRPAEDWWNSYSKTLIPAATAGRATGSVGYKVLTGHVFGDRFDDKDYVVPIYLKAIETIRAEVPPERLIDLPLGSGWGPLCEGLGVAVPDAPYPHGNKAADFRIVV